MDGGQMETPVRLQARPGQEGRCASAAGLLSIARCHATSHNHGVTLIERWHGMSGLQVAVLMRSHGLTEPQAQLVAGLAWGAGQ